jgi:hypothetical protein
MGFLFLFSYKWLYLLGAKYMDLVFLPIHFLITYKYKLVMFIKGLLIISCFVWNLLGIFSYQQSTCDLSRILLLSYQYGNAMCYQGPDNLVTNR